MLHLNLPSKSIQTFFKKIKDFCLQFQIESEQQCCKKTFFKENTNKMLVEYICQKAKKEQLVATRIEFQQKTCSNLINNQNQNQLYLLSHHSHHFQIFLQNGIKHFCRAFYKINHSSIFIKYIQKFYIFYNQAELSKQTLFSMLTNIITNSFNRSLTLQLKNNIVIRYQQQRSPFDKTSYNQNWIPRQRLYHKSRKPRQAEWDDPNVLFPMIIPPLHKPMAYKQYLRSIVQKEESQKSFRRKEFLMSDVRPGDIVDITYQQTFESQQRVTHRCLVLSHKRRKSLTAALQVAIRFGGMTIKAIYLIHSPKVVKIELINKGSGNLRANTKHGWAKLTKNQLLNPKIRNRVMKLRQGAVKRKRIDTFASMKFDKTQSDNIKKIL